jgi:hypothetical protein
MVRLIVGVLCADSHNKCGLGMFILALGVILCHTLREAFIPTAKILSTSADITTILSNEPATFSWSAGSLGSLATSATPSACGLSRSISYGLYSQ